MQLLEIKVIESRKKTCKKALKAIIVLSITAILLCTLFCFFATFNSNTWVIVLNSIITILFGFVIFFLLFAVFFPLKSEIAFFNEMSSVGGQEIVGEIASCSEKITVRKGNICTIVRLIDGNRNYYFSELFGDCPLNSGDKVELKVVNGFIVEYGVIK